MMKTEVVLSHFQPLCFLPSGKLVGYRNGYVYVLNDEVVEKRIKIFGNFRECILGRNRYISRLLRLGVRAAVAMDEKRILLSVSHHIVELNIEKESLSHWYDCGEGIRPLNFTNVFGLSAFDDGFYYGEYLGNPDKKPVSIWKRTEQGLWEKVYTFKRGEINHIHNLVCDIHRDCVWIFTGDFDESSAIWKATNNFEKVECVCSANQDYRGCVVFPLPEGLLYATDAPFMSNSLFLLDTSTYSLKKLLSIDGSCIYGCQWKDKYVFSSTVEGDGRNMTRREFYFGRKRGAGIKDNNVHMYIGNLRDGFEEKYMLSKDCMPFYTFQFGVFKFPAGINYGNTLYFQPVATSKNDFKLMKLTD